MAVAERSTNAVSIGETRRYAMEQIPEETKDQVSDDVWSAIFKDSPSIVTTESKKTKSDGNAKRWIIKFGVAQVRQYKRVIRDTPCQLRPSIRPYRRWSSIAATTLLLILVLAKTNAFLATTISRRTTRFFQQESTKGWVIVVDDEEAIRNAVSDLLTDSGYETTACADAPTALKVAQSQRVDPGFGDEKSAPDCIVSDIRMPGMDGLELLRSIRSDKVLSEIPVVLLTAKGMTNDRIEGYDAGADAYLPKPFDPDELVAVVDNVIDRHVTLSGSNVQVDDLKRDLDEIKFLLLEKGGGGVGFGFVEDTKVFLAPDEREVLELLCEGLTTKEIAEKSFLSSRRVEQLLTRMFRKTEVKNRTELVRWAVSTGNVQL